MSDQSVSVEWRDRIAVVTLSRPPVNAIDLATYDQIHQVFRELHDAPDLGAVVLNANGPHFCAGNDLQDFVTMTPENAAARMKRVREAFWAIHDMPVPTIAAVHGSILGSGVALAASCDVIVAAEGSKLGTPEVLVGAMGGAKHLARLAPPGVVREMYFSGLPRPADEFVQYGSVSRVVSIERLLEEAFALAETFTCNSTVALRFAKRALRTIEDMDLKSAYKFEQGLTGELCGTHDGREALLSVVESRPPHYRHK